MVNGTNAQINRVAQEFIYFLEKKVPDFEEVEYEINYSPRNKLELMQTMASLIEKAPAKGIIDLNVIDTSHVTDMGNLFSAIHSSKSPKSYQWNFGYIVWDAANKNRIDVSKWDTSNVTSMQCMFSGSKFNGDISNWDASNGKDMGGMFSFSKFNGDLSKWDVSNVEDMWCMFQDSSFNNDSISNWNVSNVKSMMSMFARSKFNKDISNWDISGVETNETNRMFKDSAFEGDLSNWKKIADVDFNEMGLKYTQEEKEDSRYNFEEKTSNKYVNKMIERHNFTNDLKDLLND